MTQAGANKVPACVLQKSGRGGTLCHLAESKSPIITIPENKKATTLIG
jgi:hypothetical protein